MLGSEVVGREWVCAVGVDDEENGVRSLVGPLFVNQFHALARFVIGGKCLPRGERELSIGER